MGMLWAPARVARVASSNRPRAGANLGAADRIFASLEKEALEVLRLSGAEVGERIVRQLADMRYIGQGSEITVVLPQPIEELAVKQAFEAAYKALFARTPPGAAIQFVALRLSVSAPMPGSGGSLELPRHAPGTAFKGVRDIYFADGEGMWFQAKVFDRYALSVGDSIRGPAVFEEDESTFIIGVDAVAEILPDGSILARVS
jgi:N-methylhydantoinase A